jgi:hypothetical protein
MKVTLELTNEIIWAIANEKAQESAYDRLQGMEDSLNDMYATAFRDGIMWSLQQFAKEKVAVEDK